jgi:hypothetical protein
MGPIAHDSITHLESLDPLANGQDASHLAVAQGNGVGKLIPDGTNGWQKAVGADFGQDLPNLLRLGADFLVDATAPEGNEHPFCADRNKTAFGLDKDFSWFYLGRGDRFDSNFASPQVLKKLSHCMVPKEVPAQKHGGECR